MLILITPLVSSNSSYSKVSHPVIWVPAFHSQVQIFLFPIKEPFRAEQLTKNLIQWLWIDYIDPLVAPVPLNLLQTHDKSCMRKGSGNVYDNWNISVVVCKESGIQILNFIHNIFISQQLSYKKQALLILREHFQGLIPGFWCGACCSYFLFSVLCCVCCRHGSSVPNVASFSWSSVVICKEGGIQILNFIHNIFISQQLSYVC
jgi:hypothetical protein